MRFNLSDGWQSKNFLLKVMNTVILTNILVSPSWLTWWALTQIPCSCWVSCTPSIPCSCMWSTVQLLYPAELFQKILWACGWRKRDTHYENSFKNRSGFQMGKFDRSQNTLQACSSSEWNLSRFFMVAFFNPLPVFFFQAFDLLLSTCMKKSRGRCGGNNQPGEIILSSACWGKTLSA